MDQVVERFKALGRPGYRGLLFDCVLASDYDRLAARVVEQQGLIDRADKALEDAEKAMSQGAELLVRVYKLAKGNVTGCGTCYSILQELAKQPDSATPDP